MAEGPGRLLTPLSMAEATPPALWVYTHIYIIHAFSPIYPRLLISYYTVLLLLIFSWNRDKREMGILFYLVNKSHAVIVVFHLNLQLQAPIFYLLL